MRAACTLPGGSPSSSPEPTAHTAPELLVGSFVDDYGARYLITDSTWTHGSGTVQIAAWLAADRHLLAKGFDDDGAPVWLRIDWVVLAPEATVPPDHRWIWAWCMAAWDAPTSTAALEAPESRREAPRTGCGDGFPFTRMRHALPLQME